MEYVALGIIFVLSLLGSLFKCVKEDSTGRKRYGRFGLPLLTRAGMTLASLLFSSFLASAYMTWSNKRDDRLNTLNLEKMYSLVETTAAQLKVAFSQLSAYDSDFTADSQPEISALLSTTQNNLQAARGDSAYERPIQPDNCPAYEGSLARDSIYNLIAPMDSPYAKLLFQNNSSAVVTVSLFHPDDRIPGVFPYLIKVINPGQEAYMNSYFYGADWGIQVNSSCIQYLGEVSDLISQDSYAVFKSGTAFFP